MTETNPDWKDIEKIKALQAEVERLTAKVKWQAGWITRALERAAAGVTIVEEPNASTGGDDENA